MKPREFDDLVRQKFDQDDFAYDPGNWDKLAEQLDGRGKKRNLFVWWMPLVGMAASVAFALGVPKVLNEEGRTYNSIKAMMAQTNNKNTSSDDVADAQNSASSPLATIAYTDHKITKTEEPKDISNWFAIRFENAISGNTKKTTAPVVASVMSSNRDLAAAAEPFIGRDEPVINKKKKVIISKPGYYTFNDEQTTRKPTKNAILLSGGVNYGGASSGYLVGASARHMVNDKVFVEGDIAFVGTTNSQQTKYMEMPATPGKTATFSTVRSVNAKNSAVTTKTTEEAPQGIIKTANESYNLYYAQITPSLGYKIMKRMSVGVGPDFQQMLVDNRPAQSDVDRGTLKEVPTFDIGFMGKTEYAVTRNIKAAVYYREGVNNLITPTGKYIDRNYVQFQVKCAIFNK